MLCSSPFLECGRPGLGCRCGGNLKFLSEKTYAWLLQSTASVYVELSKRSQRVWKECGEL